jgi:hypothetical protein
MLPLEGEQVSPFRRDTGSAARRLEQQPAGWLVLAALVDEQQSADRCGGLLGFSIAAPGLPSGTRPTTSPMSVYSTQSRCSASSQAYEFG